MEVGESVDLAATASEPLEGSSGPSPAPIWRSDNPTIIVVDDNGVVTAMAPGHATVVVRMGDHTDSASIRVGSTPAATTPQWAAVYAGYSYTCALNAAGERYCWGANQFGAHGNGTRRLHTAIHSAQSAGDPLRYRALSSGSAHGCGITAGGEGYCWGNNSGRATDYDLHPQRLGIDSDLREISSGLSHACALASNGGRYCWGSNMTGALGMQTEALRQATPRRADEDLRFSAISSGLGHTCALDEGGKAFCWGTSSSGGLGDGSSSGARALPHPVSGGLVFASISAGNGGTCALTAAGEAYCWGALVLETGGGPRWSQSAVPQRVDTDLRFAEVKFGAAHACGRTGEGAVFCWGSNNFGKAGVEPAAGEQCGGDSVSGTVACVITPRRIGTGLVFHQISVGLDHACGVTTQNEVYCWGRNEKGQLGHGRIHAYSADPVRVAVL